MIDAKFVFRKIKLIEKDLAQLEVLRGNTFHKVASNFYKYNTLEWILVKVIGRAFDINHHLIAEVSDGKIEPPLKYRETFLAMGDLKILPKSFAQQIAASAGFRNALVHDYNDIDRHIVYKTVDEAIDQYLKYCDYIMKFLKKQKEKKR